MAVLKHIFFSICIFLVVPNCHAVTTYYASGLGCVRGLPIVDPTGTTIILDVNLTISPSCSLTFMGNGGPVTITATGGQQLIISSQTQWNIASLTNPHFITFTGNAQLIMMPGSEILADQVTGLTINFQDETAMSVQP